MLKVLVCAPNAPELTGAVTVVGVFRAPDPRTPPPGLEPGLWQRILATSRFGTTDGEDELLVVPDAAHSPDPLLLVSLGDRRHADLTTLRSAMGRAMRRLARFTRVATNLAQLLPSTTNGADEAAAVAEGALRGSYTYPRKSPGGNEVTELLLVLDGPAIDAARRRVDQAAVIESAVEWARDLTNQPANLLTPAAFADEARTLARSTGLDIAVKDQAQLAQGGFGGLLAVGGGSANAPCLVELTHAGQGTDRIALVGKGITFDSGGLQVKGKHDMELMRSDMAGAAAVLATAKAAAELGCSRTVHAVAAVAENLSGSHAYRPGDVLTHRGGKTSEVLDTDAEGRIVLADALAYAAEFRPAAIVDVATLTYDVVRALGDQVGGVLGSDRDLIDVLLRHGRLADEPLWELPLWQGYRRNIGSRVADVRNTGGAYADAIHAALFLAEFTAGLPWAHLDVGGTAFVEEPERADFGATGVGVRTLTQWLMSD